MSIVQRGTDSSGRPIYATAEFWTVFDACCRELGFTPTIVQGGWLKDAAAASAATHAGDALDIRLRDRSSDERHAMVLVFREHAIAYWERYENQGFDLHAHMVPGPWASPSPQALDQWNAYLAGRDGLAKRGPDYHLRPNPLVTEPPEDDTMPLNKDDLTAIRETVEATVAPLANKLGALERAVAKMRENVWRRDLKMIQQLAANGATLEEIEAALAKDDE